MNFQKIFQKTILKPYLILRYRYAARKLIRGTNWFLNLPRDQQPTRKQAIECGYTPELFDGLTEYRNRIEIAKAGGTPLDEAAECKALYELLFGRAARSLPPLSE